MDLTFTVSLVSSAVFCFTDWSTESSLWLKLKTIDHKKTLIGHGKRGVKFPMAWNIYHGIPICGSHIKALFQVKFSALPIDQLNDVLE